MQNGKMILGKNLECSVADITRNQNVIVCGAPGTGKSTLVKANLYQAVNSYVISDPKGRLYAELKDFFADRGYRVLLADFKNIGRSNHYNPFSYITSQQDILAMAHILADQSRSRNEPFWDDMTCILYSSLIAYLKEEMPKQMHTLRNMISMLNMAASRNADERSELDFMFQKLELKNPESWAVREYKRYRCMATRTLQSVLSTAHSKLASFDTPEIHEMTSKDDIDLPSIGKVKTAVFLVVSDVDRSMDPFASLFVTQCMKELINYADNQCRGQRLPVPVSFLLDDFATNLSIQNFPRMISSFRSRGINSWIVIQSKGQLESCYREDAATIIGASDTFIYQGSNDVESARLVAERSGRSVQSVMNLKIGTSLVLRRGEPVCVTENIYDLSQYR